MSKIGIIGAMELEIETLKEKMNIENTVNKANMSFFEGTLNDTKIVLVKCGIGKVNAGICAQILADNFEVTHIINTGVAGSLDAKLDIGDIVVSTSATYHDMDVTIFGYKLGEVPQLGTPEFFADETLVELSKTSCETVNPTIKVFKGRVVSGDQFICSESARDTIVKNFDALCTEMEGAAIAHGAFLNKIPFVVIRAISDKADNSAEMDYPTFEKEASIHCAKLIEHMLPNIQ